MADSVRSTGPKAARVLEELADRRQRSVVLALDRPWLSEFSRDPNSLLERMAKAKLLYRVGGGRYVVAPRGTFSPAQAAPIELLIDVALRGRGPYFIGFLNALVAHQLTDLHTTVAYVAIPQESDLGEAERPLPAAATAKFVRLAASKWPASAELERVRALRDTKEFYWRSSLERTLVDALARPDASAGIETVITCWARARQREVDWDTVCAIASAQGSSMVRRTAFLLRLLGLDPFVARNFPGLTGRGARTPLDRSDGFSMPPDAMSRDRITGVTINVPEGHLLGWVGAAAPP